VTPTVISVDQADEAARTKTSYEIPFPVLSDPNLAAHRAYRVVHEVGSAEYARLASFGIDLERASGRKHHAVAVPALFVVDAAGVVRWAHADPDYKVRPSVAQLLGVLDGLGLTPSAMD
jgi:peroxiredoxin